MEQTSHTSHTRSIRGHAWRLDHSVRRRAAESTRLRQRASEQTLLHKRRLTDDQSNLCDDTSTPPSSPLLSSLSTPIANETRDAHTMSQQTHHIRGNQLVYPPDAPEKQQNLSDDMNPHQPVTNEDHPQSPSLHDPSSALRAIFGLYSQDLQSLRQSAAYFRSILSIEHDAPISQVMSTGIVPRMVELAVHNDNNIRLDTLAALTNITMGSPETNANLLSLGILQCYALAIQSQMPDLIHRSIYGIGNIALDSLQHRQYILDTGFLPRLLNLLHSVYDQRLISRIVWAVTCLLIDADPRTTSHVQDCVDIFDQGLASDQAIVYEAFVYCASSIALINPGLGAIIVSPKRTQHFVFTLWNAKGSATEVRALDFLAAVVKVDPMRISIEAIHHLIQRITTIVKTGKAMFTCAATRFVDSLTYYPRLWAHQEIAQSISQLLSEFLVQVSSADDAVSLCIARLIETILMHSPPSQDLEKPSYACALTALLRVASHTDVRVIEGLVKGMAIAADVHSHASFATEHTAFEESMGTVSEALWAQLQSFPEKYADSMAILRELCDDFGKEAAPARHLIETVGDASLLDDLSEKGEDEEFDLPDIVPDMDD